MNQVGRQRGRILEDFHRIIQRKYGRLRENRVHEEVLLESYLYLILAENPLQGPRECSRRILEVAGRKIDVEGIIIRLRKNGLNLPEKRRQGFDWLLRMQKLLRQSLDGDREAFFQFVKERREMPAGMGRGRDSFMYKKVMRILLLLFFYGDSQLENFPDRSLLLGLKDVLGCYCLDELEELIGYSYNFPKVEDILSGKAIVGQDGEQDERTIMAERLHRLERALERSDGMLQDLQDEFERQIEEAKIMEFTAFFSRLNSDRYGYILDELFALRRGIDKLRRESYDLPLEIRGLLIMVTKLLQFVKDSHIDPMMKLHAELEVSAEEIENCVYEGTPFTGDERKKVVVISPGWIFRDTEIQISRPKVKEVK